ncbi:MAG: ATP-dependent RNA helicase HrpA [Verrucomicrobiaceae bacterium]|nr:ATP-dependent RNA helicase HrpA [Verrucomicrobiaceae bacterium]
MKLSFPEDLPVSRRREDIRSRLMTDQVVIVCGDTGSGKTTQLPKIALEMGRGTEGRRIGCTQPRRIAATSVARRVADELQVELGREVGYQIRFEDRTDRTATRVKFMTDGVLLAETRKDPQLRQYDTLIIDEAHERSLNIDFILGYLHRTLARRPDLKVVISSATLDAEAFSDFFHGAPVIEVEGRTYPVTDLYQEALDDREPLAEQICRAVEHLGTMDRLGDTLVFLPGEREIRDATDLLEGRKFRDTLVLPLFARQAGAEQSAVFHPVRSKRRIILATNVAETSLTIPGIRFVIDSGLARVSRHDPASGIQRLQIEPVSQASARQRRGRCGRISEGVCVRLYSEEDFESRPPFTDPEILRSNLSGVVLQMEHLGLGDPLAFPFVDPPQPKRVAQAYRVLEEIGALRKQGRKVGLTGLGQTLARLPLDPRIGRILVAAEAEGCLAEGLVIASALTVQDPRERPQEKQQAADEAHAKFRDKRSDFTGWLKLWFAIDEVRSRSGNQLRKFCRTHFLNYRRTQEWLNLHRELRDTLRQMKWKLPPAAKSITDPGDTYSEPLHRAILAAIPSQIGMNRGRKLGYQGARDSTFHLFPGSGVFGGAPAWVMAFEIVETAKLYARNLAVFDPGWVEKVAPHLCRYRYSNPHWVAEQGAVYGEERVVAFGLPVVEKRRVHYGRIDRALAREIFLLEALVNGNTRAPLPVLQRNRETVEAAERLEHKTRRLGGLVHPENIVAFYEEKIPATICTQKDFEKWAAAQPAGTLDFALEDCIIPQREPLAVEDFPDELPSPDGESFFPLRYLHNPSDPGDGITATVPLVELPHLPVWFGEWLVPGWLEEKVSAILRCLRKELRTMLPANREVVEGFVEAWQGYEPQCGLVEGIIDHLHDVYELDISSGAFDLERLPPYLHLRFEIVDDGGRVVGSDVDLADLQTRLAGRVRDRFGEVSKGRFEKARVGSWSFGDLPREVALDRHTTGFPGLYDSGGEMPGMRLWPSSECALAQHRLGAAALYRLTRGEEVDRLLKVIFSGSNPASAPAAAPSRASASSGAAGDFGSLAAAFGGAVKPRRTAAEPARVGPVASKGSAGGRFLSPAESLLLSRIGADPQRHREDLVRRVVMDLLGAPYAKDEWEAAVAKTSAALFAHAAELCESLGKILRVIETLGGLLDDGEAGYEESIEDARRHFDLLLTPGWLLVADFRLTLLYFQGLEMRLTRMLGAAPVKDLQKLERYEEAAAAIWREDGPCACGRCLPAIQRAEIIAADNDLRLKCFAPEIRARMK